MSFAASDVAVAVATVVAALVSGLAGFAFNLVAAGIFLQFLPPTLAVPLMLVGSLAAQVFAPRSVWRAIDWRRLWPFVVAGLVGTPLGTWVLVAADVTALRVVVGTFLVAYSLYALSGLRLPRPRAGAWADGAIGFVGGVLGGIAGLSGAVPTVWCMLRGWAKDEARAVYQPFIVAMQVAALVSAHEAGAIDAATWRLSLVVVPVVLACAWAGGRLYAHVNDRQFRLIVLWLLLASGLALVVPALAALAS